MKLSALFLIKYISMSFETIKAHLAPSDPAGYNVCRFRASSFVVTFRVEEIQRNEATTPRRCI